MELKGEGNTKPELLEDTGDEKEPVIPKAEHKSSLKVDVDISAKPIEEKRTINLLDDEQLGKKASEKTEQEIKNPPTANKMTAEEYKQKLIDQEKSGTSTATLEQFEEQAESIINIMDLVLISIFRLIAKDSKDAAYVISDPKKIVLRKQLKNVLIRYNAMFPIVGLFIITLVSCYATPALNAWSNRKLYNQEKERKKTEDTKDAPISKRRRIGKA